MASCWACLLATKNRLADVQNALRQLGLSHLLAVSGYHVSLVSLVFFLLMRASLRWVSVLGLWVFVLALGH